MKALMFAVVFSLSLNVLADNQEWVKQDRLQVSAESIRNVSLIQSPDQEIEFKVINLDRADELYDVAIVFGNVSSHQTFLSSGYTSEAGDVKVEKNSDGSYQASFIMSVPGGQDEKGNLNIVSKDVSVKIVLDKEGRASLN